TGTKTESPLNQIVESKPPISQPNIEVSGDPVIQKKQIPPLDMEIVPYDDRLIIPRINQNLPIVKVSSESLIKRDWDTLEKDMQEALKDGVVHYPGTSLPGQTGNVVITGHSSYFPWDPGRFKDVFALLHDVVEGDKIVIFYNQDKYIYEVDSIKVVLPEDIEVLKQTTDDRLTLITCTPVGTNLKRLIVSAKLISKNGKEV
ncbi:MAG: class D sortase, partial [Patescibacteria group bacterium]